MAGDVPPDLLGSCGSFLHRTLYVFAGSTPTEYTNEVSCASSLKSLPGFVPSQDLVLIGETPTFFQANWFVHTKLAA